MVKIKRRSIVLLTLISMVTGALVLIAIQKLTAASICVAGASLASTFAFLSFVQKETK